VIRFHTIAPLTPAMRIGVVTADGSTTPLAIVLATCVPSTAKAAKLKKPAHSTAIFGVRTRVDTTVAMEFAASWKPLMKSKVRARTMMTQTSNVKSTVSGS
jgi:hypothetical protein